MDTGILSPNAVYFSTRKTDKGWIAEKIFLKGDELVRERIGTVGGRQHALEQFKIAVSRYWTQQYRFPKKNNG